MCFSYCAQRRSESHTALRGFLRELRFSQSVHSTPGLRPPGPAIRCSTASTGPSKKSLTSKPISIPSCARIASSALRIAALSRSTAAAAAAAATARLAAVHVFHQQTARPAATTAPASPRPAAPALAARHHIIFFPSPNYRNAFSWRLSIVVVRVQVRVRVSVMPRGTRGRTQAEGDPTEDDAAVVGEAVNEKVVLSKCANGMIPMLFMLALLAYLDRSNISFAAHDLRNDTGIGDAEYGLGSSAFFVGYATLQLPSMLGARYFGAPCWLAMIMSLWGVVAALFAALCCHRPEDITLGGFYILRFLLGALESGAFPSMYYYLALVFEADELTLYYPRVTVSTAIAGVIGGVIAAGLLALDGVGGLGLGL